jgi:hypothetical protein
MIGSTNFGGPKLLRMPYKQIGVELKTSIRMNTKIMKRLG